jgi:rare lipoprotein A (peptidoglycan hydrolase)
MLKKLISTLLIASLSLGTIGYLLQPTSVEARLSYKRKYSKVYRVKRTIYKNSKSRLKRALYRSSGIASWYGYGDGYHGKRTASGKIFNMNSNMCAHNGYRFGTLLRVTNVINGKSTVCNVQDTGSFNSMNRAIDLSYGSFSKIASVNQGLVRVKIEKVK